MTGKANEVYKILILSDAFVLSLNNPIKEKPWTKNLMIHFNNSKAVLNGVNFEKKSLQKATVGGYFLFITCKSLYVYG